MAIKLVLAVVLLAACVSAQQPNYYDADYNDYQEVQPRPQPRPAPRAIPSRPAAPQVPRTTPVPILKQINRHNDDGSYTYGFEGADGTFKIETKFANGDVKGKYGFVDDTGKVRTVEYGADRYGFQPAGEGITVAPPTYVDESLTEEPELEDYRPRPAPRPQQQRVQAAPRPRPQPQPQRPQPQYVDEEQYHQGANFEQQTTFNSPQYQVQEPQEAPRRSASPVPQRPISIAGAAPVPQRPHSIPGAAPAPVHHRAPVPQRPASFAGASPVPQRPAAFAGAAPAPARPLQIPGAFQAPDPVRPRSQPQPQRVNSAPRAGPSGHATQAQFYQPQPQAYQPQPQAYQPAPQQPRSFQAPRAATGSVLDQLAKDYALPSGGAPTHDITFSSHY